VGGETAATRYGPLPKLAAAEYFVAVLLASAGQVADGWTLPVLAVAVPGAYLCASHQRRLSAESV
jgi:hypothetical protein